MKCKKICVITGTRAEYYLLKPIMYAIREHDNLDLQLVVTGMHLVPEYGYTVDEIRRDGFHIDDEIEINIAGDSYFSMAKSLGIQILGLTQTFKRIQPDFILVMGDRIEAFAGAITASILNIPIIHSGGGQSTGGIDNNIRHSISKLAHIHLVRSEIQIKRLLKLGEQSWRIHNIGNVFIDTIKNSRFLTKTEIESKFSINLDNPLLLVIFHIDTLDLPTSIKIANALVDALLSLDLQTILIYPNTDAGGKKLLQIYKRLEGNSNIKIIQNLPQNQYFSIMKNATVFIGNSSSGVIEAPYFNLPFINLGERQKNRDKMNNIIEIGGETEEIVHIVQKILNEPEFRKKLYVEAKNYDQEDSSKKVVEIISKLELNDEFKYKSLSS